MAEIIHLSELTGDRKRTMQAHAASRMGRRFQRKERRQSVSYGFKLFKDREGLVQAIFYYLRCLNHEIQKADGDLLGLLKSDSRVQCLMRNTLDFSSFFDEMDAEERS